jgi:hypothetical protein
LLTLWKDNQRDWYNFISTKKDGKKLVERYMEENLLTNEMMGVVKKLKNKKEKNERSTKCKKKISSKINNMKKPPSQQSESVLPRQLDAVLC